VTSCIVLGNTTTIRKALRRKRGRGYARPLGFCYFPLYLCMYIKKMVVWFWSLSFFTILPHVSINARLFWFWGKNSAILFQFLASSYQINIFLNFTLSMNLFIHSFHTKMHIYSLILLYCISTAAILCFKKEKKNSSDLSKKRHLPGNPSSSNTKVATIFMCGGLEACCMCVDFRSTN
jgi:hypothetical protein